MKKIIISIIVIGCLLTTSMVSANAFVAEKESVEMEIEQGNSTPVAGKIYEINPTWFKTWNYTGYDNCLVSETTHYNDFIYTACKVYSYYESYTAIYKFDLDGNIISYVLFEEYEVEPKDIIAYDDHIYVLGEAYIDGKTPILLKYTEDLEYLVWDNQLSFEPRAIEASDGYIYITGMFSDNSFSDYIFISKINCTTGEEVEFITYGPEWGSSAGEEIKVYDDYVYVTGYMEPPNHYWHNIVLLKYKKDNLQQGPVKEFIMDYEWTHSLVGIVKCDDYLYVSGYEGRVENSVAEFSLWKFDTDLNLSWEKTFVIDAKFWKDPILLVDDMILYNNEYLYIGGSVVYANLLYFNDYHIFLIKCDLNGEKQWIKTKSKCLPLESIDTDSNGDLYLSGTYMGSLKDNLKGFLLKCNNNGGLCNQYNQQSYEYTQSQQYQSKESETISFSKPAVEVKQDFINVNIADVETHTFGYGEPNLPYVNKVYTFPFGTKVENVEITFSEVEEMQIEKKIEPAPLSHPLSTEFSDIYKEPDFETLYDYIDVYPEGKYGYKLGAGLKGDERVIYLTVTLYPIQYKPNENIIYYTTEATIDISYTLPESSVIFPDDYDLLIISPEQFESVLQPLINHKNNLEPPVRTMLTTLEDIPDYPEGEDIQADIKLYIKEAIETYGITHLLLVGAGVEGEEIFPVRHAYVPTTFQWGPDEDYFPSDLYYADIYDANGDLSDWDAYDGDGNYAEYGQDLPYIDIYPDVYLGRLPANSVAEVSVVVDKIINYKAHNKMTNKILLCGGDTFPFGQDGCEGEIANEKVFEKLSGYTSIKLWGTNGNLTRPNL